MIGIRVILATGLALLVALPAAAQTQLFVDAARGNDAVSRAQNSAATPWRTIGRAAWGSTNRNSPNASEAAAAGDIVHIAGGTYAFSGTTGDRWAVVYNPANNGTANAYITFACEGACVLTAPSANGPVIGAAGRNYIKWFADVNSGHSWIINACGHTSNCGPNVVNTTADTGPVVCNGSTGCWVEGATIDGGPPIDYRDNFNAIRVENCTSCTIRNNSAANFTRAASAGGTNHNQSIITMYGTRNSIIEHNVGRNSGAGVYFKDTGTTNPQSGNHVRYNRFESVNEVIAFSITNENRNFIYQNVGIGARLGVAIVAGGLSNDWIFNNTFYRMSEAALKPSQAGTGGRFWNNICLECSSVINTAYDSMPGANVIDLEHNVYYGIGTFYAGGDGNRNFAGFKGAYPVHESAAPPSIEANPLFVNAAAGDFRLCTGAGTPAANCSGRSPALDRGVDLNDLDGDGSTSDTINAGAYVTNTERIGLTTAVPLAPTNLRIVPQ